MDPMVITVSAPATIANLGPGYDLMGLALDRPRDTLKVRLFKGNSDSVEVTGVGAGTISTSPERNSSVVAGRAVLKAAGKKGYALDMKLKKGVPPRMGMGSSGASSAAGAYAVNVLLGSTLNREEVLRCAMEGERAACGAAHADNVAPALFGGVTLILGFDPMRVVRFDPLKDVEIVVISPEVEIGDEKTRLAREVLPASVPLPRVINQMDGFANLLIGLVKKDPEVMGRGISSDVIIEPTRAKLIPGFDHLKRAALEAGAYGFSISGAGPSVFALCPMKRGAEVGRAVKSKFAEHGVGSEYAIYMCGEEGASVVP
jgi:homoserine kinase